MLQNPHPRSQPMQLPGCDPPTISPAHVLSLKGSLEMIFFAESRCTGILTNSGLLEWTSKTQSSSPIPCPKAWQKKNIPICGLPRSKPQNIGNWLRQFYPNEVFVAFSIFGFCFGFMEHVCFSNMIREERQGIFRSSSFWGHHDHPIIPVIPKVTKWEKNANENHEVAFLCYQNS